jgi:hypothetical protein
MARLTRSSDVWATTGPQRRGGMVVAPLVRLACQERLELREGHVLGDEALTATGKAWLRPVADPAPGPPDLFDVAAAAALWARHLNGNG